MTVINLLKMGISGTKNSDLLENTRYNIPEEGNCESELIKIFNTYYDKDWDYEYLIKNQNISIELIKRIYIDDKEIYLKNIFFNENFTLTL